MTITIGILCGGRSGEHQVSLLSARGIYRALDRTRFRPLLVGIDRSGQWHGGSDEGLLLDANDPSLIRLNPGAPVLWPQPKGGRCALNPLDGRTSTMEVDVFFPIVHGTDGEDGALQGMLRLMDVPFTGAGVLGSAVGMDKDVMKRLLAHADLPVAPWVCLSGRQISEADYVDLSAKFGAVLFVKPATLGSSVGVSRVESAAEFRAASSAASRYDTKIIVESAIAGREIEVSVLGDAPGGAEPARASLPGEIVPRHGFYSYAAKYLDPDGAELIVPANLDPEPVARVQALAVQVFNVLACEGMARVDFFLTPDGRFVVNEINTLPGFTSISMYPKLWEASGLSYSDLLTRLIDLALARHRRLGALVRDFRGDS